jgi:hypothetical protein
VNDDPVLDLFPFDFLDFSPPPLLPPIAGGSPDLQDFANILEDIITAPWELAKKVGKMVERLWDWIWDNIGGGARWLYNQVDSFSWWLWHQVEHWGGVARDAAVDAGLWVWKQVEHWGGVARDAAVDAGLWVWKQVEHWGGVARDAVGDAGLWVWKQVEHWGGVARDAVWDAGQWVWKQVEHWGGVARDAVWDAARWTKDNILDPIMGAMQSVGELVGDALEAAWKAICAGLDTIRDALVAAIKWPWEHIMEPFGNIVEDKLSIPRRLIRGEYTSLLDFFDDITDPPIPVFIGIGGAIVLGLVIGMVTTAITTILVAPLCLPHTQDIQRTVGAELLTVGVVQEALDRGFIDPDFADDQFSRMGYSGKAKEALIKLCEQHPGASDLMRMADKRVWSLQVPEQYGQYAELPEQVVEYMAKIGYSEEWTRNFWRAHWDLPSPQQVFEMLHRRVITEDDIVQYLGLTDWLPFFRDKLMAISYNPITRVDLRRLYKLNIITEEEVKLGYMDLGYNEEKAGWLTEFTKQWANPEDASQLDDMTDLTVSTFRTAYRRHVLSRDEALDKIVLAGYTEDVADFVLSIDDAQLALNPLTDADIPVRDLTTSIILQAYRDRIWDRDRTYSELEALGYLPGTADLLLSLEDYKLQRELMDLETTVVKEEYQANGIDRPTASTRLDALDVLPDRRDLLLQRWDLENAQSPRRLTVSQMQTAFRNGLWTDVQLLAGIIALGYNDTDAKLLVDMTDKEPESTARRLSVGQLQRAYKAGLITDAQLLDQLLALQYSEEDAKVLVDMATPAAAAKQRQLSASQLTTGFRAGLVTEDELLQKLAALGYAQADAELLRDIAAQKPEPEPRRLSLAQLKASYKAELITKSDLLVEVLALGYTDRDAGWLVTLIAPAE